tara:strand:- start:142 stop:591 length:450 start_codon:yes stop_codon:yes gene_type:complete
MDLDFFFNIIRNGNFDDFTKAIESENDLINIKDERGTTPLILACYNDRISMIEFLLEKGVDVNQKDLSGNSALMGACFKGFIETVKILIKHNVTIDSQNFTGSTALIYSAMFKQKAVYDLLLESGANPLIKDKKGNSANFLAKQNGLIT